MVLLFLLRLLTPALSASYCGYLLAILAGLIAILSVIMHLPYLFQNLAQHMLVTYYHHYLFSPFRT